MWRSLLLLLLSLILRHLHVITAVHPTVPAMGPLAPPSSAVAAPPFHRTSTSSLLRLPAALLQNVCSFLSSKQLLITLARASNAGRSLLSPACFSSHELVLDLRDLSLLSARLVSPRSFYGRVLAQSTITVHLSVTGDGSIQQLLDSLDHFPACRGLLLFRHDGQSTLFGFSDRETQLTDSELFALLRHPTTLTCDGITLDTFTRRAKLVPVEDRSNQQVQTSNRLARLKRSSVVRFVSRLVSRKKPFDWSDIRLPAVTHLLLLLRGEPVYNGGATFLTAHTGLVELGVSIVLVSVDELTGIFRNSAALPHLARFILLDHSSTVDGRVYDVTPLVAALATTVVVATGTTRPMESLILSLTASYDGLFAAAASMTELTTLQLPRLCPGWLHEWSNTAVMSESWPHLQDCTFSSYNLQHCTASSTSVLPLCASVRRFFQWLADRPIQALDLCFGQRVTFEAAAMTSLAACHRLQQLSIATAVHTQNAWLDWTDAALLTSVTPACLSNLRELTLLAVVLSEQSVVAIASAAPQLRHIIVCYSDLTCSPAIACAIFGAYCEHVERVQVCETRSDRISRHSTHTHSSVDL